MDKTHAENRDCMEAMRQYPDGFFDLAVVDPPYGVVTKGEYMTNSKSTAKLAGTNDYHMALWNQEAPGRAYFEELLRVSKNQIIWGGNYFTNCLPPSQGWIFWDKENGQNSYADGEMAWTSFDVATRLFRFQWAGMMQGDRRHKEKRIHPTQKPVALYKWIFSRYAKPGDKLLDTHLGSGSSRVAAYDLGFEFWGFEIDPVYFRQEEERFAAHIAQQSIFQEETEVWEQTHF